MITTLKNGCLQVKVSRAGAELVSVRALADDNDYIWRADPEIWGRHAPILFPIVGMLNQNRLQLGNWSFRMTQHGFARDSLFELVERDPIHLEFELRDSEKTRVMYPYAFRLRVGYRLAGNRLSVSYRVSNPEDSRMYFSIGAHPGFACPLEPGLEVSDHLLKFEKPETAERLLLKGGLLAGKRRPCLEGTDTLEITPGLFDDGALVFDALDSTRIVYTSRSGRRSITVEFEGFPYLGVWSKPGVPFVCIEPWHGIADRVGAAWEFNDKPGVIELAGRREFSCQHHLTFD